MEVCLRRISQDLVGACLRWTCSGPVSVRLRWRVYMLDSFDLRLFSSGLVVGLLCWFSGALIRQLPDCVLQQRLSNSDEVGAMTTVHLHVAPITVVVARWSMSLDVISVTFDVLCTDMIIDE